MPRIFAPNDGHNFNAGGVPFYNGAAALPAGSAVAAEFAAHGYTVDSSKHALTPFDYMTREQLDRVALYLGLTLDPEDGKYEVIRDIETALSALMVQLTVTLTAGTAPGDKNVAVAGEGDGQLVYKITDARITTLQYRDYVGDWTHFADKADVTMADNKYITVCEIDAYGYAVAGGYANSSSQT
jgi:hypothetical protein